MLRGYLYYNSKYRKVSKTVLKTFTFRIISNLNSHHERVSEDRKIDENYFSCKFHQNLTFLSLSLFRFCEEDEKDPRLPIEEITSSNLIPSPPSPSLRSSVIILLYHAKWKVNQHSSLLDLSSISTVLISNR